MHLRDGQHLLSAKDLLNFLGCQHASALDLQVASGSLTGPKEDGDPYLDLLKAKGNQHEAAYFDALKAEGKTFRSIEREQTLEAMADKTVAAMKEGVDVIYQGALVNLPWHGYSDFLFRVDTPSKLGAWSYEVADTKLARTAKPKHVIQLCLYSQMVALVQELMPANAYVVLGDSTKFSFRLNDYIHYTDAARVRFEKFLKNEHRSTAAEPCQHCSMCRWSDVCDAQWEKDDHLSLVARMSGVQTRKLRAAGVTTLKELAVLADDAKIPKVQPETLARMRSQAKLQYAKRSTGKNEVEVLPLEPRRGFARLPKPDPGDLFFDMEGDPVYSAEGSLEYLFGFHYEDDGKPKFTAFWAYDRETEKQAFEQALDFITDRLRKYPDAFVYHYAQYEQTALRRLARQYGTSKRKQDDELKRLAQEYGTRENEVDDLLRNRKLVDLYKVVREGVRVSEPSYSLKNLETFYAEERTDAISSGGDSVVAFERWLVVKDPAILKDIEDYNAFDCKSTKGCRDWLLGLRPAESKWFDPEEEKSAEEQAKEEERRKQDKHILDMREALVAGVSEGEKPWRELLGFLLEYHRREARREWWDFFKRRDARVDELMEDTECLGGLMVDRSVPPRQEKKSWVHTLTIPDQDFKMGEGKAVRADTGETLDIVKIDEKRLELKLGPSRQALADVISLIPCGPIGDTVQRDAIARYAQAVIDGRAGEYLAITSILRKERPSIAGGLVSSSEAGDLLSATCDAIARMQSTHLVIQGPPGTGKTFTSAHAIVKLLKAGKRVGVQAMTHKAINNLLECVEEIAAKEGVAFRGVKKYSDDDGKLNGAVIEDIKDNKTIDAGDFQLIGGTAWFFSRPEMDRQLDYLFVDEAGQESLAKVVAAGASAKNIVLVGDQMQLSQPVKGAHPGGSGVSALEYLMVGWATVPPDRGILLSKTWRMHPDLCRFVSEAFYDCRLEPHESTAKQRLLVDEDASAGIAPTGLRFVEVEHDENSQCSPEEAERVRDVYDWLIGKEWANEKGETKPLTTRDVLVVSPYNMQVSLLIETLPIGARVGTVDRFQGQEAAVVLLSMAASSAETAPRGIDFLFSRNRLNVAISRGRCLATLVGSPELAATACRSIAQLRLVNTLCWVHSWSTRAGWRSPTHVDVPTGGGWQTWGNSTRRPLA